MPHIHGLYRGLSADSHMAHAAAQYRRSKASEDMEAVANVLAGDMATRAFEKYHDRNQSRIRDVFVDAAPRILEALIQHGDESHPITLTVGNEIITLAEVDGKLVLLDDDSKIYRIIPGKNYQILKHELANDIANDRDLYGRETADWATLIAYDLNSEARMDASTGRLQPPYELLGMPVDLWHVVGDRLDDVHSLLSLGSVNKDFDLALHETKHQILLTNMIRRLSRWSGVGEQLVASLVQLSAAYRREPLEQLVARLSSASLPELRLAGRTLVRAARWLSHPERDFALTSMVAHSARTIPTLSDAEKPVAFLSLLYVVSRTTLAHREAPLEALAAQISTLPQPERLVTFSAILTQVGELDSSRRVTAMTILARSIQFLRESERARAFESVLAAVHDLAPEDREQPVLALAGQSCNLRPNDRRAAFLAALKAPDVQDHGLQASVLTVLVNGIGHLPEEDRLQMFQRMLDATDQLDVTYRQNPLQAAADFAARLRPSEGSRAFQAVIHASAVVDAGAQTTMLLTLIKAINHLTARDVRQVLNTMLAAADSLSPAKQRVVLIALPRVIEWMPEHERRWAFDTMLEKITALPVLYRNGPLESLARRLAQLPMQHRHDGFYRLLDISQHLAARDRCLPLMGLVGSVLSLPRRHVAAALRSLSTEIAMLPPSFTEYLRADLRRFRNMWELL